MKPRRIVSTKVLAVAALSAAGCTPAGEGSSRATATSSAAVSAGATSSAPSAAPSASAQPVDEQAKLEQLYSEMAGLSLEQAVAQREKFRPLCDQRGFPLVGNMGLKRAPGSPEPLSTTTFCIELSKRGLR